MPPLAVVGLTAESGAWDESAGALLLFGTNVAAIIATGTALLLAVRMREAATASGRPVGVLTGRTLAVVGGSLLLVAVPLTFGSDSAVREQVTIASGRGAPDDWARQEDGEVSDVFVRSGVLHVVAIGAGVIDEADALRAAFDDAGLADTDVELTLVAGGAVELPAA